MKRIVSASLFIMSLLAACEAPAPRATQSPVPAPTANSPLRVTTKTASSTPVPMIVLPTPTPWPTLVPTRPSMVVPHPIDPKRLPEIPQDLLFLDGVTLQIWQHERSTIKVINPIPDDSVVLGQPLPKKSTPYARIYAYNTQPGIDIIGLIFALGTTPDIFAGVYNGQTRLITPLAKLDPFLYGFVQNGMGMMSLGWVQLSPDGRWLSYPVSSPITKTGSKGQGMNAPMYGGYTQVPAILQVVSTDASSKNLATIEIGKCEISNFDLRPSPGFAWSSDSASMAWNDSKGIWVGRIGQEARLLQATPKSNTDMSSDTRFVVSWSPDGKWLLLRNPRAGATFELLHALTGKSVPLAQSQTNQWTHSQSVWLRDGRLLIAALGHSDEGLSPALQWYRVDSAKEEVHLAPERRLVMKVPSGNTIIGLMEFAGGDIGFGVANDRVYDDQSRGIYRLELNSDAPRKLNDLPVAGSFSSDGSLAALLTWSLDGTAALYQSQGAFLVRAIDSPLIDLQPLARSSCPMINCFTWKDWR